MAEVYLLPLPWNQQVSRFYFLLPPNHQPTEPTEHIPTTYFLEDFSQKTKTTSPHPQLGSYLIMEDNNKVKYQLSILNMGWQTISLK